MEDQDLYQQLLQKNQLSDQERKQLEKWFMRLRSTGDRRNIHSLVHSLKKEETGLYIIGSSLKYLGYNDIDLFYIEPALSIHGALEGALQILSKRFRTELDSTPYTTEFGEEVNKARCESITGGASIDLLIPTCYQNRNSTTLTLEEFENYLEYDFRDGDIFPLFRGHDLKDIFEDKTPQAKILYYDDMTDEPVYSR